MNRQLLSFFVAFCVIFLLGTNEIIKIILSVPIAILLVVAGVCFLAIAVLGKIGNIFEAGKTGRFAAAAIGTALLIIGLNTSLKTPTVSSSTTPSPAPLTLSTPSIQPTISSSPESSLSPAMILKESFNRLSTGEFFHTVPNKMTADVPMIVEAGIAQKITQQILDELEVKGDVHTRKNIKYDPMGVEIRLDVDKEAFKVRDILTGVKPIVLGFPDKWMWEVTPLKRGKSTITILAVVELKVPGIDKSYKKETVVFKEERDVQVNLEYSSSKFASSYWKEASTLVFGSGSLVWFLKWLMDRRKAQLESQADKKRLPVGFGSFLDKQSKDGK